MFVINQIYKFTELQTSYGINNVALVKGRPRILNLKELITEFIEFRHEVVVRRTQFELREAEKKAHILQGLFNCT
jgi:DNA gyrase subunit A